MNYCAKIGDVKVPTMLVGEWVDLDFVVGSTRTKNFAVAERMHKRTGLSIVLFSAELGVCEVLKV